MHETVEGSRTNLHNASLRLHEQSRQERSSIRQLVLSSPGQKAFIHAGQLNPFQLLTKNCSGGQLVATIAILFRLPMSFTCITSSDVTACSARVESSSGAPRLTRCSEWGCDCASADVVEANFQEATFESPCGDALKAEF